MLKDVAQTEDLCRQLPQLGRLLDGEPARALLDRWPREVVAAAARHVLDAIRREILDGLLNEAGLQARLRELDRAIAEQAQRTSRPSLRRVINATGVILQTNLGRAPLSQAAIRNLTQVAAGYSNLEFDLHTGKRGRRDDHAEALILRVLAARGADLDPSRYAAMVLNNCAGATFLALNSLAEGGEVIVSRGELVEIGGGFRIPEILRKSGAILREVGTTNRTRIADYARAITPETRLILRVHRSNFRIEGFTAQPSLDELVALGREAAIPVFEDQGTGCVVRLAEIGMGEQSNWIRSVASGVSLVAASGDKLLGGPQCGLLVGQCRLIEQMRTNPLARAFRPGKLTYAALEATLLAYLADQEQTLPAIAMMLITAPELRTRCQKLVDHLEASPLEAKVVPVRSVIGGGTTPGAVLRGFAVALRHPAMSEEYLLKALRQMDPPVIARTRRGEVLLDLRTVFPEEDETLAAHLVKLELPA